MSQQLKRFLDQYGDTNGVFYLGHAAIMAVLNGKKILFDPIVESQPYDDAWVFFPPQVDHDSLYDVDAVLVSHIHQDHYDLKFLKGLRPEVKIIIVGQRPSFEADIAGKLGREITVIPPETVTEVMDGVFMYGVNHESNGIDSSVIAYTKELCVYHGNDNYLKPESMAKFPRVNPRIDVACIPYAYIHWYPFLMEYPDERLHEKDAESDRLVNHYMDDFLAMVDVLKPRVAIPFGANLLIDDGNARSTINMSVRTPIELANYAHAKRPDLGNVVLPMLAGDFCGKPDGPDGPLKVDISHAYDAASYRDAAHEFLSARPQKTVQGDFRAVDLDAFVALLNKRLEQVDETHDNVLQFQLEYQGAPLRFEIDLLSKRARQVEEFNTARPRHRFALDQVASADWLSGKSFLEIIGTRRFTLLREPDLYLPEVLRIVNTVI
ncbi:MBL fold metallo-hydrolase [Pseudoduganella namucuonensis]|uniref:L-ascorbate metabolism protein UlaG, beta-lactamase superfamily n=1 Tax=Pseudoduganella namucuonensis TaxID=1035707 RepID=A0A1I7LV58_9BURK|nr:MBL fold metallo-hydrolase [Pseudoduganella namucuonensis]SFV13477.1 L-ascorbate metabolism protein UlaG, beta-lactamase superfamily [Pseudoduganella namucuonensis]